MSQVFYVFLAILFHKIEAVQNNGMSVLENNNICENNSCLSKNQSQKLSNISNNFKFTNGSGNMKKKDIYFVGGSEKSQMLPNALDKNTYAQKFQEKSTTDVNFQVLFEGLEKSNISTDFIEALSNATGVIEVRNFTIQEFPITTQQPNVIKTVPVSTVKLSISTTQPPFITSYLYLSRKNKKIKNICFCDLQGNQCDINCCCDEDCSFSHYKVFTKCIDDVNVNFDTRYCYKTNFIFGNNSFQEVIQSNGGLFCIVRENAKTDLDYKTKAALKSMETFNKSLPKNLYAFSYKTPEKIKLLNKEYFAGSPVWSIQKGELIPFKILHSSVGLVCNSELNIKYLVDQEETCFYQQQPKTHCKNSKIGDMLQNLRNTQIIFNPNFLNNSEIFNFSKICKANTCNKIIFYWCETSDNKSDCKKISDNPKDFSHINCWIALSHIKYQIWHNGSEGIMKIEAYLWVKNLPMISDEFLLQLTTEVRYKWVGSRKIFKRSGNPGYLTGKPILAGRKVFSVVNSTSNKKEAIELSVDPKKWLSVLGSEKGICSSKERIPINFRENSVNICSLKLNKSNFSQEKCAELQNNIFNLLIGSDIINETKDNFFNKFIGSFGNSRIEETEDWVQVLINLFPVFSSQTSFKSNHYHLTCKNMITDLYIGIVYSNIGSFLVPQAKILGVAFQFGKHKDVTYYCDTPSCENTSHIQYFKLSSVVHFVDITAPAIDSFAEPLSLEAKLPHDFFYPFFSKTCNCQFFNKFLLVLLFLIVLF